MKNSIFGDAFKARLIKQGDIACIFDTQRELNILYNGEDWALINSSDFHCAALHEFYGEFWKELEGVWKFFGNCPINREAAIFELVDVVCFMTSVILIVEDFWLTKQGSDKDRNSWPMAFEDEYEYDLGNKQSLLMECGKFLSSMVSNNFNRVDFQIWLTLCLHVLEVSPEKFMEAYLKKTELNRHRAVNGAVEGTYDKSKEPELRIEL